MQPIKIGAAPINVPGIRAIALGPSTCQQAHYLSGAELGSSGRSWMSWLEVFSYGAIRFPIWKDTTVYAGWEPSGVAGTTRGFWGANMGVSGQKIDQIGDRIFGTNGVTKTIFDYDFDVAFLDDGTNNIGTNTAIEIFNGRVRNCQKLIDKGKFPIFIPIRGRPSSVWTAAQSQTARYANALTADWFARQRRGLYLDWNTVLIDGASATGQPKTGYLSDGTHDAPIGGMSMAWWMWHGQIWTGSAFVQDWPGLKTVLGFYPGTSIHSNAATYSATDNPYGNLFPNCKMLGTGGTVTGSKGATGQSPDNCTVERSSTSGSTTVASSVAARPDGKGNKCSMLFTPGGSSDELFYLRNASASPVDVSGLASKWIEATLDVSASAFTGWVGTSLRFRDEAQTLTYYGQAVFNDGTSNLPLASFPWDGRLRTPLAVMGPAPTTLTPRLEVMVRGTGVGASPTIEASNFCVNQIPDPR